MFARLILLAAVLPCALLASSGCAAEADVFFESKVRPILADRCYECHSAAKKVKGGLRLDTKEGWQTGGDSGPALVPGTPDKSLLIEAIRYGDLDMQMPPKKKLPEEEIAVLEQWIREGAFDPRHEEA